MASAHAIIPRRYHAEASRGLVRRCESIACNDRNESLIAADERDRAPSGAWAATARPTSAAQTISSAERVPIARLRAPFGTRRFSTRSVDTRVIGSGSPSVPDIIMHALRIAVAVIAGILIGGTVNMALIMFGPSVIAPPPGVDMTTAEGLQAGMALLEPRHFVFPFLAHALGTLVGALVGALLAPSHRWRIALAIGVVYLGGGIAASTMIPAPVWFIALDLVAAYLPMAWLGARLADRVRPPTSVVS
jgi:hypothetical protein